MVLDATNLHLGFSFSFIALTEEVPQCLYMSATVPDSRFRWDSSQQSPFVLNVDLNCCFKDFNAQHIQ